MEPTILDCFISSAAAIIHPGFPFLVGQIYLQLHDIMIQGEKVFSQWAIATNFFCGSLLLLVGIPSIILLRRLWPGFWGTYYLTNSVAHSGFCCQTGTQFVEAFWERTNLALGMLSKSNCGKCLEFQNVI